MRLQNFEKMRPFEPMFRVGLSGGKERLEAPTCQNPPIFRRLFSITL